MHAIDFDVSKAGDWTAEMRVQMANFTVFRSRLYLMLSKSKKILVPESTESYQTVSDKPLKSKELGYGFREQANLGCLSARCQAERQLALL